MRMFNLQDPMVKTSFSPNPKPNPKIIEVMYMIEDESILMQMQDLHDPRMRVS